MFGYVIPHKCELKIKDYELYRAYYCGVCKAIDKYYGVVSRFTLNYDITFLAVMLLAISDEKLDIKEERCIAHPIKSRKVVKANHILEYAADMNIILSYLNLVDKWEDDRSVLALTGMAALKRAFNKAAKKHPVKTEAIKKRLRELSELEKEKCDSMDRAAEPFSKLMEEILLYEPICKDEGLKTILKWIGYNTGKWIYTIDALDDLEEDIKGGAYNPIIHRFEYNKEEDVKAFRQRIVKDLEFNLYQTLSQLAKGFELLDLKRNGAILDNIIYDGMGKRTEMVLKGERNKGGNKDAISQSL